MSEKVMEMLADKFIEKLEQGTAPWRRPWSTAMGNPGRNAITSKAYRGYNFWATAMSGYNCPLWLTFKQARENGASVRKGQKGTRIVYVAFDEDDNFRGIRFYTVFNLAQMDLEGSKFEGIELNETPPEVSPEDRIESAEKMFSEWSKAPKLYEIENRAYYSPTHDIINMPDFDKFASGHEYYATLFHESVHATGHESRLSRKTVTRMNAFGSYDYGVEELIAELGSARICYELGFDGEVFENSASYVSGWIKKIKADPSIVYRACVESEKAYRHIAPQKEEQETLGETA